VVLDEAKKEVKYELKTLDEIIGMRMLCWKLSGGWRRGRIDFV
jgi:hypothetical protein